MNKARHWLNNEVSPVVQRTWNGGHVHVESALNTSPAVCPSLKSQWNNRQNNGFGLSETTFKVSNIEKSDIFLIVLGIPKAMSFFACDILFYYSSTCDMWKSFFTLLLKNPWAGRNNFIYLNNLKHVI